ncbi:hypothetical protein XaraCFBP7407_09420 [Xanthomonas arboricola pv. arracaciae]|uniref:hypothetical protein n=1 Tax=Xanthomonas arboricola TaxID=56448 RepID=UPI000CEF5761|nr:hypothetical protein [Xanthomonas arboricola]PPT96250.1 hypothetical protein XaraCFBP7407_09420 [Xanthomonas arboricola pv. arracaciae]
MGAIPSVVSRDIDTELLRQGVIPGLMRQGGLSYTDAAFGRDPLLPGSLDCLGAPRTCGVTLRLRDEGSKTWARHCQATRMQA